MEWLEDLYRSNYKLLYRVGSMFIGPDAARHDRIEDEIHEVFLLAWEKRAQLKSHPNAVGWLVETMRRRLLAQFRKWYREQKRHSFSMDDENCYTKIAQAENLRDDMDSFHMMWDKERMALLTDLLGKENAELFCLYCVNRVPAKELTVKFHVTEACIRMRANRIKKKVLEHPEIFSAFVFLFVLRF